MHCLSISSYEIGFGEKLDRERTKIIDSTSTD